MPTIRVSDESINTFGFRVITAGIQLDNFLKNPIMLWMHNRATMGSKNEVLPIGKWVNVKIVGNELHADPVFDETDDFALSIKRKFDSGIINMASIGINPIELSEDPTVIIPGQMRPTVTKSELKEISVCDLGSNKNACKLYTAEGTQINLSEGDTIIPLINKNKEPKPMKQIALALGLAESATEGEILTALNTLKNKAGSADALATQLKDLNKNRAVELVSKAVAEGKILAEKKDSFLKLAESDFDNASVIIGSLIAPKKPIAQLKEGGKEKVEGEETFDSLQKTNPARLADIRLNEPERYKELKDAYLAKK